MKKEMKVFLKPTVKESIELDRCFYLPGWQFESLIGSKSTLIENHFIGWKMNEIQSVKVYGLRAVFSDTQKPCFGCFFVSYENRVFQFRDIFKALSIITLLKKEFDYEQYERKLNEEKWEARKKIIDQRNSAKNLAKTSPSKAA